VNSSDATTAMPVVFISHGSPMVAVQRGPYQDALAEFGREVRPSAIVAISAHWGSSIAVAINGSARHTTTHDFGGFPPALYELTYNPPGSPQLAKRIAGLLHGSNWEANITTGRGLDHGVWIPLRLIYPAADIPVVELSVPLQSTPEDLFRIGNALAPLRREGVLILGSGGVVHNLRLVHFEDVNHAVDPWAEQFDRWFADAVEQKKLEELFDFRNAAPHAELAVPTFEHFAPVFVVLGATSSADNVSTLYQGFEHGNISMRSFAMA
jgi:4,5-DOPA dioxygenase extradiol